MSECSADLLARSGPDHWWAVGMRRIVSAMLGPVNGRVLDVGCGPAYQLIELGDAGLRVGVDRSPFAAAAACAAASHSVRLALADAMALPFASGTFGVALALDLLEQSAVEPAEALTEIRRVLEPRGRLLVRVPAHPWLYGPHDRFWGGARRFRRRELDSLVESCGFRVTRLTFAGSLIFPQAVVTRLLAKASMGSGDDMVRAPNSLNRWLAATLSLEAAWLRRHDQACGLSLICLAER